MEVLDVDEIFVTIVSMCSVDVLYGLYTRDPAYERSAISYFGLDGLYIGIKLRDDRIVRMLCDVHGLGTTADFIQFLSEYDNEYLFKHQLPMSYIEMRWNDNMNIEKHLRDVSMRHNEGGIDFILTRERLWKSTDHIIIIVTNACDNKMLCKKYMNSPAVNDWNICARYRTERVRRGLKREYSSYNFGIAIANERWDSTSKEGRIINLMDYAIAEGNMKLIYNPVVPDYVESYVDTTPLCREDVICSIECAMEGDKFRMEMLEYFNIQPHELVPNLNCVSEDVISFSLFCELRDKGYLESTSRDNYSAYHYLYDMQRGLEPRELDYSDAYNIHYLFVLFMKCNDSVVKYNCAQRMFEIMDSYISRYHPYMIRKICDWNRDLLNNNRLLIEQLIKGDVSMKEWYDSKY